MLHDCKLIKIDYTQSKILNERFPNYNKTLINESKIDIKSLMKITHSESSNYYCIKPMGKRILIWFTYIDEKLSCIIKFIDNINKYTNNNIEYFKYPCNFDNTLSYNNVLLSGYYSRIKNNNFIIFDKILNYNNYNYIINNNNYYNNYIVQLKLLKIILDKYLMKNNSYFYLPFITTKLDDVFNNMYNLNYLPFGITMWNNTKKIGTYLLNNKKDKNIDRIFKVYAGLGNDLYYLYCLDKGEYVFHNSLLVNTYKSSVYMNNIFRKIRENKNLDFIEESEDEDDFENIDENKFVDLNKSIYLMCSYNKIFNKWIPKYIIDSSKNNNININVITNQEANYITK